ncbi:MAG: LacI family transcriptional regulator [Defluviitaleaceae bacterium]|nr:LacI family transcriptional regulator [Defluviitaleaceae bacterium]
MHSNSVTIDKVSEMAGVSKTTVSRYLNGKFEHMSDKTRDKIKAVIQELDYRPSPIARCLKSQKTGLIGVIVSDITNPVTVKLIKGIIDCATPEGYQVVTATSDETSAKEQKYIQSMFDRQVEGLIVVVANYNEYELLESLQEKGAKIVLADRPINKPIFDTVTTDNYAITRSAIKSLYNMGYDEVGLFSPNLLRSNVRLLRYNAFYDQSIAQGKNPDLFAYVIPRGTEDEYKKALADFMGKCKGKHVAAFASTPTAMLSLIEATHELGLAIPNDLGVLGFDNLHWSRLIFGGITVIEQPFYEVGFESAKMLIKRIKNEITEGPKYIELNSKLVLRNSTKVGG